MDLLDQHIPGLFFVIFMFVVLELGILMVCVGYSGNHHILKIYNPDNELIYQDVYDESHINEFKRVAGIEDFQKQGYVLTRTAVENPFPTRAWISLSIAVPLVLMLFVVFIIRVFSDVFLPQKEVRAEKPKNKVYADFEETKFEKLFAALSRLNIYALGVVVLFAVFFLWMIPDLVQYIGALGYQTIVEFKWVFLGIILFGGAYLMLRTWLSYKTRTDIIRQQAEIQKNRDRLVIEAKLEQRKLLEDDSCRDAAVSADSFEQAEEP
jgi:hypothetical protein